MFVCTLPTYNWKKKDFPLLSVYKVINSGVNIFKTDNFLLKKNSIRMCNSIGFITSKLCIVRSKQNYYLKKLI